jgi:signal transduction histidine kinase
MTVSSRPAIPESRAFLRLVGPIAVLVGAMLLLPVGDVRPTPNPPMVFGMLGTLAAVADQIVGETLLVVGAVCWLVGLRARIGLLAVLAGVCWFGPDLYAQAGTAPLLRATGRFLLAPMLWPLLVHLGAATLGLDGRRSVIVLLGVAYLSTAGVALGTAVTYDARFDLWCGTTGCSFENPYLLVPAVVGVIRRWRGLDAAALAGASVLGLVLPLLWLRRTRARDLSRLPAAMGSIAVGIAGCATAVLLAGDPAEDLRTLTWQRSWGAVCVAVFLLAMGVGVFAVQHQRRLARLRRFRETLDATPTPGTLEQVLRDGLGDASLRIGYELEDGTTVDAAGRAWEPSPNVSAAPGSSHGIRATRRVIPVERNGVRLALIDHLASVDATALEPAFTPTVLVALDNERLRAARLAQLAELRASRARIVAVSDGERRRLERDLHDGVQQHLLSLLFDIRLARLAAERAGDTDRTTTLADAETDAQAAIAELRRIAQGVHPAVLSRAGLGPALEALADEASVPVEVSASGVGRAPEAIEGAAYQAVADAVAEAAAAGARAVTVGMTAQADALVVTVVQEGAPTTAASVPTRIADRVGAAGGTAIAEPLPGGGRLLRVELPCA